MEIISDGPADHILGWRNSTADTAVGDIARKSISPLDFIFRLEDYWQNTKESDCIIEVSGWISCDSGHLRLKVCYCLASRNNVVEIFLEIGGGNFTPVVNVLL